MITFQKHSGIYTLKSKQELPLGLEQAWDFFSSPKNLATITPPHMGFEITSEVAEKAYAGQIITYSVGILPGIRSSWVTEITSVKELSHFIDEQRFGPYSMWHHEHFFERISADKTLMTDKISYKVPLGFLGQIMNTLFIESQLRGIFTYRSEALKRLFSNG